jgi:hypothetical protein
MRITRTSRPRGEESSRFDGSGTEAAWVRDLQRARESLITAGIQAGLFLGAVIAVAALGRAVWRVLSRHGDHFPGWVRPAALALVGVGVVAFAFVLWYKVRRMRLIRREVADLTAKVEALRARRPRHD